MTSLVKAAGLATLVLPNAALALLDKPALWPNLDFLKSGLASVLPGHSHTVAQFQDGWIANACKERAIAEGYDPWKFKTYVVTYDDCGVEWLMCRHENAAIPLETFLVQFGKVPVHMRQAVKAIMLGRESTKYGAYAYGDMLVMFGSPTNVAVYIHEATHAVDWSQQFAVDGQLSTKPVWINAYNADSAVPDDYARNTQQENLAQQTGLLMFNRWVSGGVAGTGKTGFNRLSHQQTVVSNQGANGKYGGIYKLGVQCTNRKANGGFSQLPPKRRSTGAMRRAVGTGPLPGRTDFPNTEEEQKAYVEAQGIQFDDSFHVLSLTPLVPTNCTGFI
ncbi:hypothetical protein GQ53DRAFT_820390 [Thozetella sp. PMI_491]|nr:hypothetical protein GQ53DRAFT_820390 [Thozetella sp. PMI_491]